MKQFDQLTSCAGSIAASPTTMCGGEKKQDKLKSTKLSFCNCITMAELLIEWTVF